MYKFKEYRQNLCERVLSIGLKPEHEKYREQHRQQIHDLIQSSYKDAGGYGGLSSGSKEESNAIHNDISSSAIKAVRRDGKITAAVLYKKQHGRKAIASGTDGSQQGKTDWKKIKSEDIGKKRAWMEVSGKPEHMMKKMGAPEIPVGDVPSLIDKKIEPADGNYYTRTIGGQKHRKIAMGFPKKT